MIFSDTLEIMGQIWVIGEFVVTELKVIGFSGNLRG